jgi:glycerophosphoryl diester phosphodiesterase
MALLVAPPPPVVPLARAHAHNDYAHKRPLLDALNHGFTSVEADVFLSKGHLLVGHTWLEVLPDVARDKPQRTLQSLYLDPLRERIRQRGAVYDKSTPFYLLIDLKTEGKATYAAVHDVLAQYPDVVSITRDGKHTPGPVTVVISGNTPREMIRAQKVRYAGIDGRPGDLDSSDPPHLMPWISDAWRFRWRGNGAMPEADRAKLRDVVRKAHAAGRQVRYWATPESESVWRELYDAGVDRLNTDQLGRLRDWLQTR